MELTGVQEAEGEYVIKDYPLEMVRRMVDYLYTGNYSLMYEKSDPEMQCKLGALSVHAVMFALADKYLIEGLKGLAQYYFCKVLRGQLSILDFLHSMRDVYQLTPESVRELRDQALYFARENLPESLGKSCQVRQAYEQMFVDVPEFTRDLLDSLLRQPYLGSCSSNGCSEPIEIEVLQSRCKRCGRGGANNRLEKYRYATRY